MARLLYLPNVSLLNISALRCNSINRLRKRRRSMNGVMVNSGMLIRLRFGHCRHLALMSNRWNYLIKQVGQGMYMVNACLVLPCCLLFFLTAISHSHPYSAL